MFSNFEPNVKAVIAYLKQLNVNVNNTTVNVTLQNHPDWPSLLCVGDSLSKWHIPNAAGKIEISQIEELPTPFIAYTSDRENPLAIVKEVTGTTVNIFQKNYRVSETITKNEFLKNWDGVYLIAEPDSDSGEENYKSNRRKGFFNSLIPATLVASLIIFSLYLLNNVTRVFSFSTIAVYLQYFILLAGVVVTSLLLWYEIDKNNPLLKKVCTGIAKGDCNAILTGKQSKVFSWLSWSEIGFFYFTGSLLVLLNVSEATAGLLFIIAWLNILALPYTIFSLYYQWRVAKQWCVLCLAVQALLILGGINVITNNFLLPFPQFSFSILLQIILLYSIPVFAWFVAKPYILRLQEAKNTKREYLRIKFNATIFETLLKKQKQIAMPANGLGIDIGNPNATNEIIKVCNPYCGPCAKMHPKIEEIISSHKNVKAKIIFTALNDKEDMGFKPVQHLLAVAAKGNNEITHKALDDWYLPTQKDYEIFAAKYKMNGELEQQGNKIEAMDKWCKATAIAYTPTIFVNGYQLPDTYGIEDLEYFLQE